MTFKKSKTNFFQKFLLIITYIILLLQLWIVFITKEAKKNQKGHVSSSFLFFHKISYYFFLIMTIWSHIKATYTNPGKITALNNPNIIEFYLNVHDIATKRAEKYNELYSEIYFNKKKDIDFNESENEFSDKDDEEYEPLTSISDDIMNNLIIKYKIKLKRCFQCFVVRPPKCHHCSYCKSCILKMDYHCPWTNNCIGQFTRKFFLLFCFYFLIGNIEVLIIEFYYGYYKYKNLFVGKIKKSFVIIQLIFNILFSLICNGMIRDQINRVKCDTVRLNFKEKKFEEKRKLMEVVDEIFGRGFGISWFFPIKIGGYKPYYDKLMTGRKRL